MSELKNLLTKFNFKFELIKKPNKQLTNFYKLYTDLNIYYVIFKDNISYNITVYDKSESNQYQSTY